MTSTGGLTAPVAMTTVNVQSISDRAESPYLLRPEFSRGVVIIMHAGANTREQDRAEASQSDCIDHAWSADRTSASRWQQTTAVLIRPRSSVAPLQESGVAIRERSAATRAYCTSGDCALGIGAG